MLWSAHHSPAQAQLPPAELAQTLEEMGGRNTPDHRVCGGSALMSWKACELVWRRGWRCTTSASGSTINSVVPGWPSPTCWDGELTIHTKRLIMYAQDAATFFHNAEQEAFASVRKGAHRENYEIDSP